MNEPVSEREKFLGDFRWMEGREKQREACSRQKERGRRDLGWPWPRRRREKVASCVLSLLSRPVSPFLPPPAQTIRMPHQRGESPEMQSAMFECYGEPLPVGGGAACPASPVQQQRDKRGHIFFSLFLQKNGCAFSSSPFSPSPSSPLLSSLLSSPLLSSRLFTALGR